MHKKIVQTELVNGGLKINVKVSQVKADIRNEIEKHNDTLDLLADLSNAFNDFLAGNANSAAIQKYKDRQSLYIDIINEISV
jgi:hypothetical protein